MPNRTEYRNRKIYERSSPVDGHHSFFVEL